MVLTANTRPTLNDVTHDELTELLARAAPMDGALGSSRLTLVASGNGAPLIDLRQVSDELARVSRGADLVVLVGMGRSVESNHSARFTCPVWKIAMIKDAQVAESLGGSMFDAVFKSG